MKSKKRDELLSAANEKIGSQQRDNAKLAEALIEANKELARKNEQTEKHAEELIRMNKELAYEVSEKEKRTAELETAVAELESFTYSVSHDLRAPLRAINGFTRVLAEDYLPLMDEEGKIILDEIIGNSKKMGQLIDNLLDFSRLGKRQPSMSEVDMEHLAEEVVTELKQLEPSRKLEVEIDPLPKTRGDRYMLKQVLTNLIGNAFKYTSKNGGARVEMGAYQKDGHNIYFVKDNGAGFDMRYYDKLFGVFQRLHSSNEFEGNGVGLAIVQKVISKHNGKVWGEGKVNEGACFYFSLPVI